MKLQITKRKLRDEEIDILVAQMPAFPHIGFIHKNLWKQFQHTFVATERHTLVGVCVAFPLKHWIKLGPLIVTSKFQAKGYGKMLLLYVVNHYYKQNVYIGSANPAVWKLARSFGFRSTHNIFCVPLEIYLYLLSYLFSRFSILYIADAIKKRLKTPHRRYVHFFKENAR